MDIAVLDKIEREVTLKEKCLEVYWREAQLFSKSGVVPATFKDNPHACYIAIEMARMMLMPPITIMQNMYLVYGTPSFKTSFQVSRFNTQGRFKPLRYEFVGEKGKDNWGCRACAVEIETGEIVKGTEITIAMAKSEGWYEKAGSKWKTMPEQMLQYRAAAFFIRVHCPEILNGMLTTEEQEDITELKDVTNSYVPDIENANTGEFIDIDEEKTTEKEIEKEVKEEKKDEKEVEKEIKEFTAEELF